MYYIRLRNIPVVAYPSPPKKKSSHNIIYLKFKEFLHVEEKITLFAGFQDCSRIFKAQNVCLKQIEIYSNV